MSRSPRKLLSRAVDALAEMEDVFSRPPQAEADVRATLGDEGLADVRRARDVLTQAAARFGAERPPDRDGGEAAR